MFESSFRRACAGAAVTAAVMAMASAGPAAAETRHPSGATVQQGTPITISCYRGPWSNEIVVDRANTVFVESLQAYGLSYVEASLLSDRICRDPAFLNNLEAAGDIVREAIRNR